MALNLFAFYLIFPYIYGGGASEKEGGQDRYRVDKSTKLCTAIAYCSAMNIRGGAQCK